MIGTKTAGIPELIPSECVVRRKARRDIAEAIIQLANPEKMTELAKMNFEEAMKYQIGILNMKRKKYFTRIS